MASIRFPNPPAAKVRNFRLAEIPQTLTIENGRAGFRDASENEVVLTLNPALQEYSERLLNTYRPPYAAVVALDPHTGAILAAAGSSRHLDGRTLLGRASFPAASLFKVVTGAAAVELANMRSNSLVAYRGGTHLLCPTNYLPNPRLDRKRMTLADAMGKSCNPVFARVALTSLQPQDLERYAKRFGFNAPLQADFPIDQSRFSVGVDQYGIARTAAGYEGAKISPIHAAALAGAVANGGELLRPYLIDEVRSPLGETIFDSEKRVLGRAVSEATAKQLIEMMRETTLTGTARGHFLRRSLFTRIPVAGKTGTLKGDSPEGLYHWFIGLAPADKPEIAIATLVIEQGGSRIKAAGLASSLLDSYFRTKLNLPPEPKREIRARTRSVKHIRAAKKPRVRRSKA